MLLFSFADLVFERRRAEDDSLQPLRPINIPNAIDWRGNDLIAL